MRMGMGLGVGQAKGPGFPSPREIARSIVNATEPVMAFVFGSSRCSAYGFELALMTAASDIPWNGLAYGDGYGESAGHTGALVAKPGGSTALAPSATIPGVETAFGSAHVEITFDGNPHTGANLHARRMQASSASAASGVSLPLLFARMSGRTAFLRSTAYRHAAGVNVTPGTGPRLAWFRDGTSSTVGFEAPNAYHPSCTSDTTGSGYVAQDTTPIPSAVLDGTTAYNWDWSCDLNWAGGAGQILATDAAIFALNGPGVTLVNWSVGGVTFARWTSRGIISDAAFNELMPLKARGFVPQLWLEAGHSSAPVTVAATRASIAAVVERFRAVPGFGRASAMVFVSYPFDGAWSGWPAVVAEACAPLPGVLCRDASGWTYADGVAAGYYPVDDTVHANAAGRLAWAGVINNQLVSAAA